MTKLERLEKALNGVCDLMSWFKSDRGVYLFDELVEHSEYVLLLSLQNEIFFKIRVEEMRDAETE